MEEQCSACRFWESHDGYSGDCHRYPPRFPCTQQQQQEAVNAAGDDSGLFDGFYPTTYQYDWCGEWQQKAEGET